MNVYANELRLLRGSFLVWVLALAALASIYLSVYPAFAHDATTVTQVFAKLPPAVRHAMGTGGFEVFSFLGFIANILPIFLLAGAIQAMNMGITMTNRERLAGTSDFLLSKPRGRTGIFAKKLLAHLSVLALMTLILGSILYVGAHAAGSGDFSRRTFLMILAVFSGVQLWFLSIGILVSQLFGRLRGVIGISMATAFGFFVLAMFGSVIGDETIRYLTPFKYIDLLEVVKSSTYEAKHVAIWAVIVVVSLVASWGIYTKRDVKS